MSEFWQGLGASLGIGAAKVGIALDTPVVGWGETASGTAYLVGGDVSQNVERLVVNLMEHWTTTTMAGKVPITIHHYRSHAEAVLKADFTIAPGEQLEWPFALTAPWSADFARHWFIGGRAYVGGAADPGCSTDFHLTAPPIFARVADELVALAKIPVGRWGFCHTGRARMDLVARDHVSNVLDGVRLELLLADGRIVGEVIVNPQELTTADLLRSLVFADRVNTPLDIVPGDLAGARSVFEEALRPHLDVLRSLPVPAGTPAPHQPEELPVPSSPPAGS